MLRFKSAKLSRVPHAGFPLDKPDQSAAAEESVGSDQLVHSAWRLKKTRRGFRSSPFRDNWPVSSTTAWSRHPLQPAVRWHGFICIRLNVSSSRSVCCNASTAPLLIRGECSCEPRGLGSVWKEEPDPGDAPRAPNPPEPSEHRIPPRFS